MFRRLSWARRIGWRRSATWRGGKVVTVISGLDPVATDLSALLKQFRTSCGAGGTVKDGTIEIQGDHRAVLIDCLRRLGYPAKAAGG